jgi:hypothetical protein
MQFLQAATNEVSAFYSMCLELQKADGRFFFRFQVQWGTLLVKAVGFE